MQRLVYCVCCGRIVEKEKAGHIFQTGYYKVTIPLGECSRCMKEQAAAAYPAAVSAVLEPYGGAPAVQGMD